MPPPVDKRNRTELGSSDSDSGDIRESLTAIHQQLQKLNLLEQLTNDVKDLKASVILKYAVMSKGKELKNSGYSISDQFPAEIMSRRRLLYPILTEARKNKKNARLFMDKLYIDGSLYRDPSITYWLSGGAREVLPTQRVQHGSPPAVNNVDMG